MTVDARERSVCDGAPLELYEIVHGSTAWRYTSADTAVVYDGHTYTPATITRGEVAMTVEDDQGQLEITVPRTHPVAALYIPGLPLHPVTLTVYAGHQDEAEWVIAWSGEFLSCAFKGSAATLTALPVSRLLRRLVPATTYQAGCNWHLYSAQCGLDRADYVVEATLTSVSGATIEADAFDTFDDRYFRLGEIVGPDGDARWVEEHLGRVITLQAPLASLAVGDVVHAYPGCTRTRAACQAFDNYEHFLGFAFVPNKNPFVSGVR
jgi:uncharacterized phage protein (TIGR02218 family)